MTISTNLNYVGRLRYIQAVREARACQNPDRLAGNFLPMLERWRCRLLSSKELEVLRRQPFYYYLLARTRYYDEVFGAAIRDNVRYIVNVGCGTDTRAHRFGPALARTGIGALECDQPEPILIKQRMARRLRYTEHVRYLALDLNDDAWPDFKHWLDNVHGAKLMVMMEGVSPYVNSEAFGRFLALLGTQLPTGSLVAYDFKIEGTASDAFGRVGRTRMPFRLPDSREQVISYHEDLGFRLVHMVRSHELEARVLPQCGDFGTSLFRQDCLVQIQVNNVE